MTFVFEQLTTLDRLPKVPQIDDGTPQQRDVLLAEHRLTLDEYKNLLGIVGRKPTMSELGIFSAMWSEHCSYKSSRVHLKRFPTEGPAVVVGPGENAGVVRISGKLCAAFKMESHNHPSYIEPYQGAATGVGGILRDVFCMGARPVANLNCLRFGERRHPKTPFLVENVVKGIGDYGNCIGVPTVGGNVSFDATYNGNCLVNAMTVGIIHEDRIFKGYASGVGNLVVYVGSATGRDGIHGASMASDSFDSREEGERSAVQVGDPFTEKLLLEATLEVLDKGLVVGLQDMGAAGLTSSSFEMAGRAGNGLYMDLDRIPVRTRNMSAYELLLSESQERMVMVIEPRNWDGLREVLERWQLHYAVVGCVTASGRVQITYEGALQVDLPVSPLTDKAPRYNRLVERRPAVAPSKSFDELCVKYITRSGVAGMLRACLRDTGAKSRVYEQYDRHIGVRTVFASEHDGAAVLWLRSEWVKEEPWLGLAISTACNERYCDVDARQGGALAVTRAARMIAAAGGRPLAVTDCLNFGNPEDPRVMAEVSDAVDGIAEACRALSAPVVSGNVSLYNETDGMSIAPTPMIGMVGKVADVRQASPAIQKEPGELYLLLPKGARPAFGGSLVAKLAELPRHDGVLPALDYASERESMNFLLEQTTKGRIAACRDLGDGGLAVGAVKMVLGQGVGLRLVVDGLGKAVLSADEEAAWLFGELAGAYLVYFRRGMAAEAVRDAAALGLNRLLRVGEATTNQDLLVAGARIEIEAALAASREALNG